MPHISIVMERSLGTSLLMPRLIRDQLLGNQTIGDRVNDVHNTFTRWDKCMQAPFCKWPAIIALILGAVIVLSVLTCIIRCLCCGYSFCCACFSCLNCCGCGKCCEGKRSRSRYYEDKRSPEYNTREYSAPPPMMVGGANTQQYAHFPSNKTASKTVNEDALPAMPSWDTATNVHVLDDTVEEKTTELKEVNSYGAPNVPLVSAAAPTGMSSPVAPKGYNPAPFPPRAPLGYNSDYRISTESFQKRPYDNSVSAYPSSPISDAGIRVNNIRNGGPVTSYSPSPVSDAGIRGNYARNGSASSLMMERGYGAPMGSPMGAPVRTPMQVPYGETARSTSSFTPNRFGSPVAGASAPRRDFNTPPPNQRPTMGYQPYRIQ